MMNDEILKAIDEAYNMCLEQDKYIKINPLGSKENPYLHFWSKETYDKIMNLPGWDKYEKDGELYNIEGVWHLIRVSQPIEGTILLETQNLENDNYDNIRKKPNRKTRRERKKTDIKNFPMGRIGHIDMPESKAKQNRKEFNKFVKNKVK